MLERIVHVQGLDGHVRQYVLPEDVLPKDPAYSTDILRLTLPPVAAEPASAAASLFATSRDASNWVLAFLSPDSWLELEQASPGCRSAVRSSSRWQQTPILDGHSLRCRPDGRKAAYVQHRRAVWRVAKAFQDLRRFARSPGSVFNPGASLADTFRAEERGGVVFPYEARASFVLYDGQARSAWLRSEGVIGGYELLSLEESVELMLEEACFRGVSGPLAEFVPLANKRNSNEWLAASVDNGVVCVIKPLSRPKVVATSWSNYLYVQ